MRLWIFSDLHIESCLWDVPDILPKFDVIIAAGDIYQPIADGVDWLNVRACGKFAIYVPGNHEWYAQNSHHTMDKLRTNAQKLAKDSNVALLENGSVIIDNVRFLGTTLWTDYALFGDVNTAMREAQHNLNDHHIIFPEFSGLPLRASQALEWHNISRKWLETQLNLQGNWDKTIVVTHHAPHPHSIAKQWRNDRLTPAFCSDLSRLIEKFQPELWIHGHTHDSFDYFVGKTRIICNPKGYGPRYVGAPIENKSFNNALIIRV